MWRRESSRIRGSAIIPMTRNGRLATIERRASLPRKRPILTNNSMHHEKHPRHLPLSRCCRLVDCVCYRCSVRLLTLERTHFRDEWSVQRWEKRTAGESLGRKETALAGPYGEVSVSCRRLPLAGSSPLKRSPASRDNRRGFPPECCRAPRPRPAAAGKMPRRSAGRPGQDRLWASV